LHLGHDYVPCGPRLRCFWAIVPFDVGSDYGERKNAAHIRTESRPTSHRNQWPTSNGMVDADGTTNIGARCRGSGSGAVEGRGAKPARDGSAADLWVELLSRVPVCLGARIQLLPAAVGRAFLEGIPVRIELPVCRFFCDSAARGQHLFTERLPKTVQRYGRRSCRQALDWLKTRHYGELSNPVRQLRCCAMTGSAPAKAGRR
jgi:hypothetical protein